MISAVNLLRASLAALSVFLLSPSAAHADTSDAQVLLRVKVPPGVVLSHTRKPANPDFVEFDSEIQLDGILMAYWELLYLNDNFQSLADAEPQRQLMFRFYPALHSQSKLPLLSFSDGPGAMHPERVFVYHSRERGELLDMFDTEQPLDDPVVQEWLGGFASLPSDFLTEREGMALQPVRLTLSGLVALVEAGHIFTYAKIQALIPLSTDRYMLSAIPDSDPDRYLSEPWVYRLTTVETTQLLDQPNGQILKTLPAGTPTIERISSPRNGWVHVRLRDPDGQGAVTGYLETRKVLPIN